MNLKELRETASVITERQSQIDALHNEIRNNELKMIKAVEHVKAKHLIEQITFKLKMAALNGEKYCMVLKIDDRDDPYWVEGCPNKNRPQNLRNAAMAVWDYLDKAGYYPYLEDGHDGVDRQWLEIRVKWE